MTGLSCTIRLSFSAAKRLLNLPGKCNQLHGYRHSVDITFAPLHESKAEMVIDFYEVKEILTRWIEQNWDHTLVLNKADQKLGEAVSTITGQKIFYLPGDPTAEAMAEHLLKVVCPQQIKNARCTSVRLYDEQSAWVEAQL